MENRSKVLFLRVLIILLFIVSLGKINNCLAISKPIGEAKIKGYLNPNMGGDTLILTYWVSATLSSRYQRPLPSTQIPIILSREGTFEINIPMHRKIQYFSLKSGMKKKVWRELYYLTAGELKDISKNIEVPILNLDKIILEPGDDITINSLLGNLNFSGRGAEKFKFREHVSNSTKSPKEYLANADPVAVKKVLNNFKERQEFALGILKEYKEVISSLAYNVLMSDIVGKNQYSRFDLWRRLNLKDSISRQAILNLYKEQLLGEVMALEGINNQEALGLSLYFSEFVLQRLRTDDDYHYWDGYPNGKARSKEVIFESLLNNYKGLLGDKLLTLFCHDYVGKANQVEMESYLIRALGKMQDPFFKSVIQRYNADFSRGAMAINFTMLDKEGKKVQLKDFLGKVVFVDMWFTGCGPCKAVAKAMREFENNFKYDQNVVFLSISIDKDKRTWINSITKDAQGDPELSYQFPGEHYAGEKSIYLNTMNGADDLFIKKYVTMGYPTLLIIDTKGKISSFGASRPIDKAGEQSLIDEINQARN